MLAPYPAGVASWDNAQLEAEFSYVMDVVSKVRVFWPVCACACELALRGSTFCVSGPTLALQLCVALS